MMKKYGLLILVLVLGSVLLSSFYFSAFGAVSPPQNLISPPEAQTVSKITLLWDKPTSYSTVASYNVYRNGSKIGNTTKLYYDVTGLSPATQYTFTVTAVDTSKAESSQSTGINVSTKATPTVINVTSAPYNAVGDGSTLNTVGIQNAINACPSGGEVLIPAGTFKSGALFLKSNMTLEIDGTLQGSTSVADYPLEQMRFQGAEQTSYCGLINVGKTLNHTYGGGLSHITICGTGVVSGGGSTLASNEGGGNERGRLIYITNASYVNIQGLKLTNPPCWTVHPVYSTQITVHDVDIETTGISNGDGCDPDSSTYVYIFNSTFNTGDDCSAIKSGINKEGYDIGMASAYITYKDVTFKAGHGSVTIGSESSGGVHDVFAQDCTSNGNNIGLRMKTTAARGGTVQNIKVADCTWTSCKTDGFDCVTNYSSTSGGTAAPTLPVCKLITLTNITCDSSTKKGFNVVGQSSIHVTDLQFTNCKFNGSTKSVLTYVDRATFTGCTVTAGITESNCTSITGP